MDVFGRHTPLLVATKNFFVFLSVVWLIFIAFITVQSLPLRNAYTKASLTIRFVTLELLTIEKLPTPGGGFSGKISFLPGLAWVALWAVIVCALVAWLSLILAKQPYGQKFLLGLRRPAN